MEFQLGETYHGYQFLDILKRSKSGIEFRVKNMTAGRLEALRALAESAQNDREQSERFARAMRVHASLLHPNIVTLFNAIELENHLIVTTELVEGPTLADKLLVGPIPCVEAVALIRQVLSAVAYAHQQGVVHRDISPENIIFGPGGVLKLANFALAKEANSPKLTQVGLALGNLKYISPEQIKGMGDVDARSDLYALGMVLYEMLCGRPAFDMASQFELMVAHVGQPPARPDEVNAAVPADLAAVVLKALAKDPAERYQTAEEFDEALVKLSGAPVPTQAEPEPEAASAPSPSQEEPPPPSESGQEEPAVLPRSAPAASETQPSMEPPEPPEQPGIAAAPPDLGSVPETAAVVETAAPQEPAPDVLPVPDHPAVPAVAPAPAFLSAAADASLSRQQLIVGSAVGTCMGVLLVVLWLIVK